MEAIFWKKKNLEVHIPAFWPMKKVFVNRSYQLFYHLHLPGFPLVMIYRKIDQFHAGLKWVFFYLWVHAN